MTATAQDNHSVYLRTRGLSKFFGTFQALKDIDLDINDGEFVCFLGPSGCGKTTLLRAIAGLDLQTHGSVEQAGKDISNLPTAERDFGIVFQSYALFPNLTVEKNIAFGLENARRKRTEINARVSELLELVGLSDQGKKYPAQLSGGQQQRIALARAIATSPGLLLLDEPLSALDAKVRVYLRHEMKELQRKLGVTTVMVTHDQEEALSMADRIVVMNHGIIEQIGTPTEIYRHPETLFVADFIGEMNQLPGVAVGPDSVTVCGTRFNCQPHGHAVDTKLVVAIRPEDVIPHSRDTNASNLYDEPGTGTAFDGRISEMEFLGSYWRTHISSESLGDNEFVANFSMNAVRRFELAEGRTLTVELPASRLMTFAGGGRRGDLI